MKESSTEHVISWMSTKMSLNLLREAIVERFEISLQSHKVQPSEWFERRMFDTLPRTLEAQVNKLLKDGFGDSVEKDRYCSIPYTYLLAIWRGNVIGLAKLFKRTTVFNHETVTIGGFGAVTTSKWKRRKGVASALLKIGMEDFRMQNLDIALLTTDINNPSRIKLYGRVGFIPLEKPFAYTGESGKKYVEHNGMIALVKSLDKFEQIVCGKRILDIGVGSW